MQTPKKAATNSVTRLQIQVCVEQSASTYYKYNSICVCVCVCVSLSLSLCLCLCLSLSVSLSCSAYYLRQEGVAYIYLDLNRWRKVPSNCFCPLFYSMAWPARNTWL